MWWCTASPTDSVLEEGQIVSVDVGVKKDGYFGDAARTFRRREGQDEEKRRLLQRDGRSRCTRGSGRHGQATTCTTFPPRFSDMWKQAGFSVVRDLVGHGIGKNLHEEPAVPNFGTAGTGMVLKANMTLAIEPMVNAGTHVVRMDGDGWTVRTADGQPSAHFEHTVVITNDEAEILTRHG